MKVYEAVLEQLWGAGVTHFSGMVGSTSAPYASALAAQNRARYVGIRHEQVGASILDATARLSGRPGVLMVHGGSGLLAASLGVAAAALDGTPMVVLSATQERKAMENGWWQTLDVQKPVARGRRHLVVHLLVRRESIGLWHAQRELGVGLGLDAWEGGGKKTRKGALSAAKAALSFVSRGRAVEGRERTMAARQRQNQRGPEARAGFPHPRRRWGQVLRGARGDLCPAEARARDNRCPRPRHRLTPKLTTVKTCTPGCAWCRLS